MIAEFLLHPVYECGRRISATSSVWVVAEFLQHPVYESLQNFCYIHCIKGRRISATPSVWVIANLVSAISNVRVLTEFLRRLVYKWPHNFWYIQCMSDCRISASPTVWVVAKFLQHLVYESHLPQSISVSLVNSWTGYTSYCYIEICCWFITEVLENTEISFMIRFLWCHVKRAV